ncbi:MAG TPA: 4-hydroxythreonine-4-phosphate dehydrogenase PdxA [Methylophilaceae bacterium]|nr:4-hydroxythreonine-4-phosphate dehydrogenase PdxA [Methylophilaceae bacterium]
MSNIASKTNTKAVVRPRIALTAGEPAGIGPDLCAMLAQKLPDADITVIADRSLIEARAGLLGLQFNNLRIHHIPLATPGVPGKLDAANGHYVLETLTHAVKGCLAGEFDAMVTAPVHKSIINDAGVPFTGHTEFLAELTDTKNVVMMLVGGGMRVALATIHMPLREVADAITQESLETTLRILQQDLVHRFGIARPRIYVAGLNPHAGEGGHLGMEEIETITPVLEKLRSEKMDLHGPLPADTMFSQHNINNCDAFLAMYHDQGLAVLKHASFGGGVNVTLGLPIIRTSVDHGTALDLAGTGKVDAGSLYAAIELAIELATRN